MGSDASDSLSRLRLTGLAGVATASGPSSLEDEVVALFDQFRAPILRYLLSFRIPFADAEELVQEVFLSLYLHLRDGKPRDNLQGWLFRVAHNSALKSRLRTRQHLDRFSQSPDHSLSAADPGPDPEQTLAATQKQQRLLAVVRALPEQEQWCLSLRAEGLRYREIADVLGISLGSVAASLEKSLSRLARAGQV